MRDSTVLMDVVNGYAVALIHTRRPGHQSGPLWGQISINQSDQRTEYVVSQRLIPCRPGLFIAVASQNGRQQSIRVECSIF